MTKDEALKLALVALEANQPVNYCMNSNGERFPMMHEDPFRFDRNTKAITAIKAALAQPVQEPYDQTALELCNVCGWKTLIPTDACLNCERNAPLPVQPEERNFCPRCGKRTADLTTIHTCTPPQTIADEHIAKVTSDIDLAVNKALVEEDDDIQDYKKPWAGLRAEEIEKIQDAVFGMEPHYVALARAVEAKLKEKNA